MDSAPLTGVTVLEVAQEVSGPYCAKLLADFGAEVVKVEPPGQGDPARNLGPFAQEDPHPEKSCPFHYLNASKKGITLNLRHPAGVDIFQQLARRAHVLVEDLGPGVMDSLGLGYETLEKVNPALVYTSITNFGLSGPYRDYKATHAIHAALAGWTFQTGEPDREPLTPGGWTSHYMTGTISAAGTVAALLCAQETGTGQRVDMNHLESLVPIMAFAMGDYIMKGINRGRRGNIFYSGSVLPAKDGWIGVNALMQEHFDLLCAFLDMPELVEDPRFANGYVRRQYAAELRDLVAEHVKGRTKDDLFHGGQAMRIPMGLVPNPPEVLALEQHHERGYLSEVEHPVTGKETQPGPPFRMYETPARPVSPAPLLGQHNQEVYCGWLGYTREELAVLRQSGVI
ncbi:MAG: CoA transferase [Chloroflexi bacterium]|nr:CoA transferase [Chloroflexota bacterium]